GEWRSWCKRCGTRLVRVRRSKWLALATTRSLVGARVEEGRDVARVRLAHFEVRHRRAGRDMLRIANPALHIRRLVGKVAADDRSERDIIERRTDHARGRPHVPKRMAAAAPVLDEQGFAATWVAAGPDRC